MCSAYDSKENIEEAFKSGISEILPKPIKSSQLKYIIEKYIWYRKMIFDLFNLYLYLYLYSIITYYKIIIDPINYD